MEAGGDGEPRPDLRGASARLGASLLGLVRTRLELASVELAEERDRVQQQLRCCSRQWRCSCSRCCSSRPGSSRTIWDTYRLTAIAIVAVVFAGAGAALLALRVAGGERRADTVRRHHGRIRTRSRRACRSRQHPARGAPDNMNREALARRKSLLVAQSHLHRLQAAMAWHDVKASRGAAAPRAGPRRPRPDDRRHAHRQSRCRYSASRASDA